LSLAIKNCRVVAPRGSDMVVRKAACGSKTTLHAKVNI
jgi:hypothetical protein